VCAEFNPLARGMGLAIAPRLRQDADEPTLRNALRGSGQAGWGAHRTENSAAVIFSARRLWRGAESTQTKGKYVRGLSLAYVEAQMAEYTFQLRGWHAVAALLALGGITGLQMYSRVRPVNDAMRDAVRSRLLAEYSGRGPKDLARFVAEAREGSPVEPVPALVQRDVEFTSLAARGTIGGATVVRAEVTVDGGPPPDSRAVRYFWVSRKFEGDGWLVMGESNSYQYLMELMPASRKVSKWWN